MLSRKKVKSREMYTLDSLLSVFKGGYWVDDVKIRELLPSAVGGDPGLETAVNSTSNPYIAPTEITSNRHMSQTYPRSATPSRYITVIGGTKYDERALYDALASYPQYIIGGGRGVESDLAKRSERSAIVIEPDPELYGKAARKVNVEQVLSFAPDSPLLLVGSGERVKQAKQWLKRANWPREVVELP